MISKLRILQFAIIIGLLTLVTEIFIQILFWSGKANYVFIPAIILTIFMIILLTLAIIWNIASIFGLVVNILIHLFCVILNLVIEKKSTFLYLFFPLYLITTFATISWIFYNAIDNLVELEIEEKQLKIRANCKYNLSELKFSATSCPICLEYFDNNETVFKTPCDHIFHLKCIKENLKVNGHECPICRRSIHQTV